MCSRHATRPFDAGSRPTERLLQELLSELGLRLVQPAADGAHRHIAEQRDLRVGVAATEVAQERRKAQRLPQSLQRGKNPVL